MEALFENYELFIRENADELQDPSGAMKVVVDEGMFKSYADALTTGLDENVRAGVLNVLDRQREMILQEAANVPASTFAAGWTVLSFPILVDIYSEPIIAELCNVYTTNSPTLSIPRVRIKSQTRSYDGTVVEESYIPTTKKLVRANVVEVNALPGVANNVFTLATLSPENLKMNRRYTLLSQIQITEGGAGSDVHAVDVSFIPDSRNQIVGSFTFTDSGATTVEASVTGHVDYERGIITFNVIVGDGSAGITWTVDHAAFSLRFVPVATMNGRTRVVVETEMTDVFIDPNEDFLIDLTQEDIQDYQSIFKIDLARTLSEAIKRQVLLNKDYDLAYFLKASESEIAKAGAATTVDLAAFAVGGDFTPANVLDVFKAIAPRVSLLMGIIRRNYNMYPTYMVTGVKTAALLRSLQDMMVNMAGVKGELGWSGSNAQFLKLRILESNHIDDSMIYLSTKAPQNALEKSSILDLIFKPLYVVKEVTDGNSRTFVRARTMIKISRTDGLGSIKVENMDPYLG
jgi:hypothetical protein